MSELLNFDDAKTSEFESKYLEPGIHKVKVTEVSVGKSTAKQTPFLKVTVADEKGLTVTEEMYLNEGAFKYSKDAILTLVMAVANVDIEGAKAKLVGLTTENIADKLAPVLVGKPFAILIGGKWVYPENTEKKPFIKAVFGSFKFAVPLDKISELRFDPSKNIRGKKDEAATTAPTTPPVSSTASQWGK